MTFWGTRSNSFSRSTKAVWSLLLAARYFTWSCLTTKITSVVPLPGTKPNGNSWLTPTVWWGPPQSFPGLSWLALLAGDRISFLFPMHPPYPCRGRQWNSVHSQRILCHHKWLQQRGHRSWRHPYHRLLISSPPLCLMDPVLCPHFIWEIALLTISVVIGIGGPIIGGSSDMWSVSKSNPTLRNLR